MTRRILLGVCLTLGLALTAAVPSWGSDGRWKDDGNGGCVFDPNDSGPDQCTPPTPTGRFKLDSSGTCVFDPTDSGPDQCTPQSEEPTVTPAVGEALQVAAVEAPVAAGRTHQARAEEHGAIAPDRSVARDNR